MAKQRRMRIAQTVSALGLSFVLLTSPGCWLFNGFIDPTKVGRFPLEEHSVGIRRVLTPRETPSGPANAGEPTPEDLIAVAEEYRIGPGDTVDVIVDDLIREGAQEAQRLTVTPSGYVRIASLNQIKLAGLTEREAEEEVKAQIKQAQLLPEPQVRLVVQEARQRVFNIIGAVNAAGQYLIANPDLRLLDAISIARDIGPDIKKLYVIRRDTARPGAVDVSQPEPIRRGDGLVIPPPSDPADDYASFSTMSGLGQERIVNRPKRKQERQEKQEQSDDLDDLREILSPRGAPAQSSQKNKVKKASERPFAPLIYDPETGKPLSEPEESTDPTERPQIDLDEPGHKPLDKPESEMEGETRPEFNWDNVQDQAAAQRVIAIDVPALRTGDSKYNIVIRNRDVIEVPVDAGVFYIMGEINRPGVYGINNKEITIKQAVAISGGFGPLAWPQRCEIIRREPGTDKQITISVDLDAIFGGLQDDVLIKSDDIVNVGSHFVAPFLFVIRNSFRFTYGFGFVYDRNFADKDSFSGQQNPTDRRRAERQLRGLPF